MTSTALALIPATGLTAAPAPRDLAAHLAALTAEQLQSLAYGEYATIVLDCDIPDWLAEAAYDEQDRRLALAIANGTLPTIDQLVEVPVPARRAA
jgi:hypothetical protein